MENIIITLPSYWASYLINRDASGLEESEITRCNSYLQSLSDSGIGNCLDVSEESYFGRFGGLGCDLADYTFQIVNSVKYAEYLEYPDNFLTTQKHQHNENDNIKTLSALSAKNRNKMFL